MGIKALYLCCTADPWVSVANNLEENLGIEPKYFVFWGKDRHRLTGLKNKACFFHEVYHIWKGNGFPPGTRQRVLDAETREIYAYHELVSLKMMDRLDPDGASFPYREREKFFLYLVGVWLDVLECKEINLIISPSVPHRVFDYTLYIACSIKNIPFLMFQMTPFEANTVIIDKIDQMPISIATSNGDREEFLLRKNIFEKIQATRVDYSCATPDYMKNQTRLQKTFAFRSLKKPFKAIKKYLKPPQLYWVQKGKSPQNSEFSWLMDYILTIRRIHFLRSLKKEYQKNVVTKIPDGNFVLIALHYQPEETTCPSAGVYANQIEIVRSIVEATPEDIGIAIKEHSTQFNFEFEGASGRTLSFYSEISKISKRIFFVPTNADPFDLIDRSDFVVTGTGTIGWESVIRETPCIVFGRAWYEKMPGVYRIKNQSDVQDAVGEILRNPNKIELEQVYSFHRNLQEHMINANHYKAFNIKGVDNDESIEALVSGISSYLIRASPSQKG